MIDIWSWNATTWSAVSAIGAAITALITLFIAHANMAATRIAHQSTEFENCLGVVAQLAEAQRRVFLAQQAGNESLRVFEFHELLNLMEALAKLLNDNRITASARDIADHFLEEAWAYLKADASTGGLLEASVTSPDTFVELEKFGRRKKTRIDGLTAAYRQQLSANLA